VKKNPSQEGQSSTDRCSEDEGIVMANEHGGNPPITAEEEWLARLLVRAVVVAQGLRGDDVGAYVDHKWRRAITAARYELLLKPRSEG
jgi:hypothetical protein